MIRSPVQREEIRAALEPSQRQYEAYLSPNRTGSPHDNVGGSTFSLSAFSSMSAAASGGGTHDQLGARSSFPPAGKDQRVLGDTSHTRVRTPGTRIFASRGNTAENQSSTELLEHVRSRIREMKKRRVRLERDRGGATLIERPYPKPRQPLVPSYARHTACSANLAPGQMGPKEKVSKPAWRKGPQGMEKSLRHTDETSGKEAKLAAKLAQWEKALTHKERELFMYQSKDFFEFAMKHASDIERMVRVDKRQSDKEEELNRQQRDIFRQLQMIGAAKDAMERGQEVNLEKVADALEERLRLLDQKEVEVKQAQEWLNERENELGRWEQTLQARQRQADEEEKEAELILEEAEANLRAREERIFTQAALMEQELMVQSETRLQNKEQELLAQADESMREREQAFAVREAMLDLEAKDLERKFSFQAEIAWRDREHELASREADLEQRLRLREDKIRMDLMAALSAREERVRVREQRVEEQEHESDKKMTECMQRDTYSRAALERVRERERAVSEREALFERDRCEGNAGSWSLGDERRRQPRPPAQRTGSRGGDGRGGRAVGGVAVGSIESAVERGVRDTFVQSVQSVSQLIQQTSDSLIHSWSPEKGPAGRGEDADKGGRGEEGDRDRDIQAATVAKEQAVAAREREVAARERELAGREKAFHDREAKATRVRLEMDTELQEWETELDAREQNIMLRESAFLD